MAKTITIKIHLKPNRKCLNTESYYATKFIPFQSSVLHSDETQVTM